MDIFSVFTLCGGLAFFLYGMNVMSSGLGKAAGGKMESLLKKMTSNPFKSLALGAGITIAIQSSSAMTVMLVGLVNSGIMSLRQTIGVIMGSNVGTTLTAWILSLSGIESSNFWIKLLKPESFSPILALIGVILIMTSKHDRRKSVGSIMVGFAVLMYGMELMKNSMSPLADMPEFASILTAFNNPILGVVVGAVFTGVIQSSAASVAILQALAMTGEITYAMAMPIIMGQNIGTCVTALLSSIGVNRNAKRVSVVHISFNLIGTVLALVLLYGADFIIGLPFMENAIDGLGIAQVHSIFNVGTTIILLPFTGMLEKIANFVVKETEQQETFTFIDPRLLNTPGVAIAQCNSRSIEMAQLAGATVMDALSLLRTYDETVSQRVVENEDKLDLYEDKLGTTLVKLSSRSISKRDSKLVNKQLHTIGDLERMGDHAMHFRKSAKEMFDKKIEFSEQAKAELAVLDAAVTEILGITVKAYSETDLNLAKQVEPLEQVVDRLIAQIKAGHIQRLQEGRCTIELGFILNDLLNSYRRTSDHCSNIAVALIETEQNAFEAHEYLNGVKHSGNIEYEAFFALYREKYHLPKDE